MGKIKRLLVTGVLTGLILAIPASSAFAYHCFVVKRSEQGSIGAGNSGNWFTLDMSVILVEEFGIDEETADEIVVALDEAGVPTIVAFNEKKLLTVKNKNQWNGGYGDGKGIDSFFIGPYWETMLDVLADFGIVIPEDEH